RPRIRDRRHRADGYSLRRDDEHDHEHVDEHADLRLRLQIRGVRWFEPRAGRDRQSTARRGAKERRSARAGLLTRRPEPRRLSRRAPKRGGTCPTRPVKPAATTTLISRESRGPGSGGSAFTGRGATHGRPIAMSPSWTIASRR